MEQTEKRKYATAVNQGVSVRSSDWAVLVFVLSAVVGALISYDRSAAWLKLALIAAGALLYVFVSRIPERIRVGKSVEIQPLRLLLIVLPSVVAISYLLSADWASRLGKLPLPAPIIQWLAPWQHTQGVYGLHPNVIGGVLAAFIPLSITALAQTRTGRLPLVSGLCLGLSILGLLLTVSYGAWLALLSMALVWVLWRLAHRLARRWQLPGHRVQQALLAAALAVAMLLGAVLAFTPVREFVLSLRPDRETIWHNSLDLARDYPLTGVGLADFEMAYSSYILLVHVGYTTHAHNLMLDIWLEQGLAGLIVFAILVVAALRSSSSSPQWRLAGIISVGIILAHGLVDDAFYGYGGWLVPLLFIPFGILARVGMGPIKRRFVVPISAHVVFTFIVAGIAALLLVPMVRAIVHSNLGALSQTQVELAQYHWPQVPGQDTVRREQPVNLTPAISRFQEALASDPANAVANRRLGQIELSQGQYDYACQHLLAAYRTAPSHRATRQLLGECYALEGDAGHAVELWRTIDMDAGQLRLRIWWYNEYLGEHQRAERMERAVEAFLQ
ncbi:MAG: O-antigen ligase family protein [Chloroflexi bacterium]|nr:O-antigen ligase family protein [Chloroflexota bacterium]